MICLLQHTEFRRFNYSIYHSINVIVSKLSLRQYKQRSISHVHIRLLLSGYVPKLSLSSQMSAFILSLS